MANPFLGEIRLFSFGFAPRGWALCNGQILPIAQNQALFSILGTTYGGNGQSNFALPDLRSRTPIHVGTGPGQPTRLLGEEGGSESHTLVIPEMPAHVHSLLATSEDATTPVPTGARPAVSPQIMGNVYVAGAAAVSMKALGTGGGSQPHPNRMPYLTLNFCIALEGLFPPRN